MLWWERLRPWSGLILDGVLLTALCLWCLPLWERGTGEGINAWTAPNDFFLYGPDAGRWADNAKALVDERYENLDFHRMPTFTLMLAGLMQAGVGLVPAGHLLNHLQHLLLSLVLYGLGRMSGSRGAGLVAGMLAAVNVPLLAYSRMYGVDPTIAFLIPLAMLAAAATTRRWWLAPISGMIAAFAAASHFTTVAHVIPPAFVVLFGGQPGLRRWLGFLVHVGICAAILYGLFQIFPMPNADELRMTMQEGVQAGSVHAAPQADWRIFLKALDGDYRTAVDNTLRLTISSLRPAWVPWTFALALPWIGVFGFFLGQGRGKLRPDLALGIGLLLCLGPMPFLAKAGAPDRYSFNLFPIALLLMSRGMASILGAVDQLAAGLARRQDWGWPTGALMLGLALYTGNRVGHEMQALNRSMPAPPEAHAALDISLALRELFPGPGHVAVPLAEAALQADKEPCPLTVCPMYESEAAYKICIAIVELECSSDGPLAFVVLTSPQGDMRQAARKRLDAWVASRWDPVKVVESYGYQAEIYALDRQLIRDEAPARTNSQTMPPIPGSLRGPPNPPPSVPPPP